MWLHNSYCYSELTDVADSVLSQVILPNGVQVTGYQTGTGFITFNSGTATEFTHYPPSCDSPGFNNSFFGIEIADAVITSWAVVSVWSAIWALMVLRRVMK